jgi:hypothetical protein
MVDFHSSTPSVDLGATSQLLASGSPRGMYVYFLLALCKNYFEVMRSDATPYDMEKATVSLIAFCPSDRKRQELWDFYCSQKALTEDSGSLYASVHCVGSLISYLSETLEFIEDSNGAFL